MNKVFSSFLIIVLTLILIGVVIAVAKESHRKYQIDKEIANIEEEIEFLKERSESLSNLLDYLSHDSSLEKEARLKLNLLREGEKLIIISSDKEASFGKQVFNNEQEEVSAFKKWQNYFFSQ